MNIAHHAPIKPVEFPPRSFVLYGQPKVGKSDLWSKAPDVLYINLEDGLDHIAADIAPPPGKHVKTVKDLQDIIAEIASGLASGKLRYRFVVLDGLSTFVVAIGLGLKKADARQAAKEMATLIVPVLEPFFALPCTRVVTLHSRSGSLEKSWKSGDKKYTVTVATETPDVSPRVRQYMTGLADAIGYCHTVNNKPTVEWIEINNKDSLNPYETHAHIVAGNRLGLPQSTDLTYAALIKHLTAPRSNAARAPEKAQAPEPPPHADPAPEPTPAPDRVVDQETGEVKGSNGDPLCEWCLEHTAPPGIPCGSCEQKGATPASRPSLADRLLVMPITLPPAAAPPVRSLQKNGNGNGYPQGVTANAGAPARLVGVIGDVYTEWKRALGQLVLDCPVYANPKGQPDNVAILITAKACGHPEITPSNMATVIEALQLRAKALQAAEPPL